MKLISLSRSGALPEMLVKLDAFMAPKVSRLSGTLKLFSDGQLMSPIFLTLSPSCSEVRYIR